jgi:hypothetical protein
VAKFFEGKVPAPSDKGMEAVKELGALLEPKVGGMQGRVVAMGGRRARRCRWAGCAVLPWRGFQASC